MKGDRKVDTKALEARRSKAFSLRSHWNPLYQDAYDYVMPMRRPTGKGRKANQPDRLFDMTAPMSAMYFAGALQRDLFPAGQPTFSLEAGPLARLAVIEKDLATLNRRLEEMAKQIHPFFLAGDWDTAVHEMCIDLSMGTGAILPVKGTRDQPLMFACIPFDQLYILCDAFGRVRYVCWDQELSADQIVAAFPDGHFSDEFRKKANRNPSDNIVLHQEWWADADPRGGWHFCARLDNEGSVIEHERYRTQPVAVARYYRVPGEAYGRGVVLTALPTIKTVNKAQELALKSAAIAMLGIWGYRAGGTFNPDTVRMGPGQFWPMQSTGGMLGPDVQRLDPANGRLDVAKMLIGDLQQQIRDAMFDTRLPEYQGTPRSASEMAGRLQQRANIHIGAFGRLVHEIMPVVVPRAAEILMEWGFLSELRTVDNLLISASVRSPMAAALNADRIAAIANYHEMAIAIAGPERVRLYENQDKVMEKIADGLQIPKDMIPTEEQKQQVMQDIQNAQAQQLGAMFAAEAAKQAPGMIAREAEQEAA
ncbi:MAG: hypothetical protein CMH13_11210 [Martelella sp.]|uniref:portal protein n=1 Tax=Martelella sp. TaxID=1969699 RepID=UPI000C59B0E7|nr:portal protein [Martelella sp.]MAU21088.1 hypothetical protein [Martelella sp.]